MTTPAPSSSYFLGITLQKEYMGHVGYIAGFRSVLNYVPKLDTVMVMVYNHDSADPEQSLADLMNPVLPLLRVEDKEPATACTTSQKHLRDLVILTIQRSGLGDLSVHQ